MEQVPDVYDDQPVIHSSQTTTETITTSKGDKKASTTSKNHGQVNTRPLFLSCNLTKSEYGNKAIMKATPRWPPSGLSGRHMKEEFLYATK